jgi:hypothetical protein
MSLTGAKWGEPTRRGSNRPTPTVVLPFGDNVVPLGTRTWKESSLRRSLG